ncbi:LCP family protein [Demequina sp.]|uniref:LCP family protein n=1 Tax=Demequina sp. TaxID=2050685 RepID=UPI003A8ACDAC
MSDSQDRSGQGSSGTPGARRPMPPSIQPGQRPSAPRDQRSGAREASGAPQRRSVVPPAEPRSTPARASGSAPASARPPAPQRSDQPAQATSRPRSIAPTQRTAARPAFAPTEDSYDEAPVAPPRRRKRRRGRRCLTALLVIALLFVAVLIALVMWVQSNLQTVDALSGAANTPGNTYLIVGSDSREGWAEADSVEGNRTDTIMVLHQPESGPTALISIPRDSYVAIPGHGQNKINAAFSWGGAPLLVETVEGLSGLTIDGYMEIGLGGVSGIVDALGGVELCYDADVSDWRSRMEWTAGCHVVGGEDALAFSRMRYSDPKGDIGRAERQRQVVAAVAQDALKPSTLLNPGKASAVANAGFDAFTFSEGTGAFDLARMALALRSGLGDQAVSGTPPIADMGYDVEGVGSTVLLDPDLIDQFWDDIEAGAFEPGESVGGVE